MASLHFSFLKDTHTHTTKKKKKPKRHAEEISKKNVLSLLCIRVYGHEIKIDLIFHVKVSSRPSHYTLNYKIATRVSVDYILMFKN